MGRSAAPTPGVYVPIATIFKGTLEQDLDDEAQAKHAVRLAKAGMTGIVVHGSNGEAVHLTHEERVHVIKNIRKALDEAGFPFFQLIVGTGAPSLKETLLLTHEAVEAGANFVIVLPPSYYASSMTNDVLKYHFTSVANASKAPVLIYNYPGVTAGIDLDSDMILSLAEHPNIVGTKLTCASIGKLTRICTNLEPDEFAVFGGMSDFLIAGLAVGSAGCISGLCNVAPRACVQIFRSYQKGDLTTAKKAQKLVAEGDKVLGKVGTIPGVKFALEYYFGYGGVGRRPLAELDPGLQNLITSDLKPLMGKVALTQCLTDYEKSLNDFEPK